MIEKKDKAVKKTEKMKTERTVGKQRRKITHGTGEKKIFARWFSLDSLMGKVLCILLVVILTVGAFLAPKLINNLYDTGTLMQITYVDMELSPYAVVYANFEDKMRAIARANTAGDHFLTLSAEETAEKISDAELIQAVNREMEAVSGAINVLFFEGWWFQLTEENLVSREKNTLYMQPQGNGPDSDSYQEAPIQFWTLTFELTEGQLEEEVPEIRVELSDAERNALRKAYISRYTTDKLIVCMDTDFYKIYAVAVEGVERGISEKYSWDLEGVFGVLSQPEAEKGNRYADPGYAELRIWLTDEVLVHWADYWNVVPKDESIYMEIPGEVSGCLAFLEEGERNGSGNIREMEDALADTDMAAAGYNEIFTENMDDFMREENEILLEVGVRGSRSETDDGLWIQKSGCRNFFDMMQF